MYFLKIILLAAGGIFFVWSLFKRLDYVAIMLFTLIVADINIDLPGGFPLNLRATVTLALFARILQEQSKHTIPGFFTNGPARHIILFFVWVCIITKMNGLLDFSLLKEFVLTCLSAYLGYYYFVKNRNYNVLKTSIIFGGLICAADLAYTYGVAGGFPVTRVYFLLTREYSYCNHNFFGYVCGTSFTFLLADYLSNEKSKNKLSLLLMPVMFFAVLLSTSRAALLALFVVAVVLIGKGLMSRKKGKRATRLITVTIVCAVLSLFLFQILSSVLGMQSEFLQTVTSRLIDEPLAMLNRSMGNSYNANNLDSMDWRVEASNLAFDYFKGLPFMDQVMGIGYDGFLARDVGHGYDAHNGLLLMIIENGVIGFVIFFTLIISFWHKVSKLKLSSPAFVSIIYIILYITSHNKELTSFFAFLIMGTLIGELNYYSSPHVDAEEEEQLLLAGQ